MTHHCRACGAPLGTNAVTVWVAHPLGLTATRACPGHEEAAAQALGGRRRSEPPTKGVGARR